MTQIERLPDGTHVNSMLLEGTFQVKDPGGVSEGQYIIVVFNLNLEGTRVVYHRYTNLTDMVHWEAAIRGLPGGFTTFLGPVDAFTLPPDGIAGVSFLGLADDGVSAEWRTPSGGSGSGDMEASVYDPQAIAADAFDRANHTGSIDVADITGLSAVATSNDYLDLDNLPSLFSGAYGDLSGLPTLGTAAAQDIGDFASAAQGELADSAVQSEDLGDLAFLDLVTVVDIDATGTPDGTTFLRGDGAWVTGGGSGIGSVVEDTSPELGGDLDPGAFGVLGNWNPESNDLASLGEAALAWSDLYLASGGVIDFANGDIVITHASDHLLFTGGSFVFGSAASVGLAAGIPQIQNHGLTTPTANVANFRWADATGGAGYTLAKSRGTTVGVRDIVDPDDQLGFLAFLGDDGTNFITGANIVAFVDGTPGTNDMPGRLQFGTTADGASTPTARLILDSVGTLKPAANDGVALGTTALGFSDLFLADGAVLNWNNGAALMTHSSGRLTVGGAAGLYEGVGRVITSKAGLLDASVYGIASGTGAAASNVTALQNALDDAEGMTLLIPPGTWYINALLTVHSDTTIYMAPGAIIKAYVAGWTGDNFTFRNENHAASSLTDSNINLTGYGLIDNDGQPGDHHAWYMRYVDGAIVEGVHCIGGGNFTSFLACKNTYTYFAHAKDVLNCGFDHWDGCADGIVHGCTVDGAAAQGIQYTAVATDGADRDAWNMKVTNNTVKGARNMSGFATGIIFNVNDAGSSSIGGFSSGNWVEDCDLGLVFSGVGGMHTSLNDTFYLVDQLPIFIQDSVGAPDNCRIINPHFIDCESVSGNIALVVIEGENNSVEGIKVTLSGAASYLYIVRVIAGAVDTYVDIKSAPAGSTGRILDGGTGTIIRDFDDTAHGGLNINHGFSIGGIPVALRRPTINAQTGSSYTAALVDEGGVVTMSNASPNDFVIPANGTIPFPVGSVINVVQIGAGVTTIDADTGVTLNGASGGEGAILARYQGVSLLKIATDTWIVSGSIGTVA